MIKKLLMVIMATLSLNFLVVAGGIAWLYQSGELTRDKIDAIKQIVFNEPVAVPATQPSEAPTTQPTMRLEELLAKATGRTTTEQVEFIKNAFDAQMAILDRRERELIDRGGLVEQARQQLAKDRAALNTQKKALEEQEKRAASLASDKGFQDSLALYNTMPPAQVKRIFAGMNDQTVMTYLQEMKPRTAARIIKEFTSPEETQRMQRILQRMKDASASIKE